jgi:hypothetical protein
MQQKARKNKKAIRSPLVPPRGARATGETVEWGGDLRHVYVEMRPIQDRSEVRQLRDPETGRPLFHPAPQGAAALPTRERFVTIPEDHPDAKREFILDDLGNGTVQKVFSFRPDETKAAAKRRAAALQARRDAILDILAKAPEDEIDTMEKAQRYVDRHRDQLQKAEAEVEPEQPQLFRKRQREGTAWFDVLGPDGEPLNEKALREADADELLASMAPPPPETEPADG